MPSEEHRIIDLQRGGRHDVVRPVFHAEAAAKLSLRRESEPFRCAGGGRADLFFGEVGRGLPYCGSRACVFLFMILIFFIERGSQPFRHGSPFDEGADKAYT